MMVGSAVASGMVCFVKMTLDIAGFCLRKIGPGSQNTWFRTRTAMLLMMNHNTSDADGSELGGMLVFP